MGAAAASANAYDQRKAWNCCCRMPTDPAGVMIAVCRTAVIHAVGVEQLKLIL